MNKIFLNDRFILLLIIANSVIIFVTGFPLDASLEGALVLVDHVITGLFLVELIVKLRALGTKGYFASGWNRLDFALIVLSLPSLALYVAGIDASDISYLLVFRITRVFKSFRYLKFIPGIEELLVGVRRALRASVLVLSGFTVYIFLTGILSFHLFGSAAPEYYSNPLQSVYTTFKVFTVEGWYEIPDTIVAGLGAEAAFFVHLFFVFVLLSGGIFGLSLVNSIFVDAMVSDNTDDLERKVDALTEKVDRLLEERPIQRRLRS